MATETVTETITIEGTEYEPTLGEAGQEQANLSGQTKSISMKCDNVRDKHLHLYESH